MGGEAFPEARGVLEHLPDALLDLVLEALLDREARRTWASRGGKTRAAQVEAERRPHWERWLGIAADTERQIAGQGKLGTRAMARWVARQVHQQSGELVPVATIRSVLRRKGPAAPWATQLKSTLGG